MSSHIRFLHGVPGVGPVNVVLSSGGAVRDVPYGEPTPHWLVPAGRNRVQVQMSAAPTEEVLRNGVIIPEHSIYTVVIGVGGKNVELLPVEEPTLELPEKSGALRVANFTRPQDTWEVWLRRENGEPEKLYSEVGSDEVTEYVVLPAGDYSLEFRDGQDRTAAEALAVEVESGHFYTIYLLGKNQPEEESFPVISVQTLDANSSVPLCTEGA